MAAENINRRLNIYINDKEVVNSAGGIGRAMAQVRNEIKSLNKGAEDYDARLKKLKGTYAELQAKQQQFRNDAAQTKGMLKSISDSLGPVATGMLAAFSVGAVVSTAMNKIREAGRIVVEFDQKQANLAATMGKSRLQIAGLTLDAIKIGATTAYSASGVSDLQNELAKLGKTAPEIKAMTKSVLNTATALETDLASAATLVGGQLNSYGENADKAAKYSDIMANSVNISATGYEYLATALPKVTAVAAQNNVTFERTNAILSVLADQNIAAETAGTGFRNILLESAKAGKSYTEMLDAVKNSADPSRKAVELFGKENATVAVILANSTEKIDRNTEALENSAGSAEKLAKEKMQSIKGFAEGFSGAWEGLVLSIEKGDGKISKAIKGFLEFGTNVLNVITPMKKLSESIQDEQLGLNVLVSRITSTNVSNTERKQLMSQLAEGYPDFVKNINLETISNADLNAELNKINENYAKRIALQKQVEKVEDAAKSQGDLIAGKLEYQEKLFLLLTKMKTDYKLTIPIDYGDIEQSAKKVKEILQQKGVEDGLIWNNGVGKIDAYVTAMNAFAVSAKVAGKEVNSESDALARQQKQLGINTEVQNEANKAKAAAEAQLKQLRLEAQKLGMKDAMKASEQEVRIWMAGYKERLKGSYELSEEERKKREREAEEARRHAAELLKTEEDLQKRLLDAKRAGEDLSIGLIKDDYERERKAIEVEYRRKAEDTLALIEKEQDDIKALREKISDPKTPKVDIASFKRQLKEKLDIQKEYNSQFFTLEQTRNYKLGELQEKYNNILFKKELESDARELQNLKTRQAFELAGITSFAKAKALLSEFLSSDELGKVTTLEQAKKLIKEKYLREQYELEKKNLERIISLYEDFLRGGFQSGFKILTDEEKESVRSFLAEAKAKLAAINGDKPDTKVEGDFKANVDILGMSGDQWKEIYANLDNFQGKIAAVQAVAGVLQNAFGSYFKFLEAGEQRQLAKFQKSADLKKAALDKQLAHGAISQDVYNARIKRNEEELAKKKAEIEYKQAKRQKAMAIVQAIVNTALGIMQAYAQLGPIGGTVAAVVIGAMGALEIATIAKQPLPSQTGFKSGGYTGDGPMDERAGDVHRSEYVIPRKVLFSNDPIVPNIVEYLEAKRTGRSARDPRPEVADVTIAPAEQQRSQNSDAAMIRVLTRLAIVLEDLEENGVVARLENNLKLARDIDKKIKEYYAHKSKAKAS